MKPLLNTEVNGIFTQNMVNCRNDNTRRGGGGRKERKEGKEEGKKSFITNDKTTDLIY